MHWVTAVHAACLTLAGVGMWCLPTLQDKALLFIPMVGVGLAWASIMGNPYIMLARSIPPERAGVYMGIFNMFIVLPMIIQMLTLPMYYDSLLGSDPRHVIQLAGCFLCIAAALTLRIRVFHKKNSTLSNLTKMELELFGSILGVQ